MTIHPNNISRLLYQLMKMNTTVSKIITECTAIVANITSVANVGEIIMTEGCLRVILICMKRFMELPCAQIEICAAVANLTLFGIIDLITSLYL